MSRVHRPFLISHNHIRCVWPFRLMPSLADRHKIPFYPIHHQWPLDYHYDYPMCMIVEQIDLTCLSSKSLSFYLQISRLIIRHRAVILILINPVSWYVRWLKMIFHIICMAMLFFQSLSIKRPNRISFPYRSMRDKSLSRLSCHSYSLSRRPIMPVIAIM